jgi:hypothetical protein
MTLEEEFTEALDRNCHELKINTPSHILAAYLMECLRAHEKAVNQRASYYRRPVGAESSS